MKAEDKKAVLLHDTLYLEFFTDGQIVDNNEGTHEKISIEEAVRRIKQKEKEAKNARE